MSTEDNFARYEIRQSYEWNYSNAPEDPPQVDVPGVPGQWRFCGLKVDSPLGGPAGPLLNGRWILHYAALGFDVLTYKTVRSSPRACYPLPNLQPVGCDQISGEEFAAMRFALRRSHRRECSPGSLATVAML